MHRSVTLSTPPMPLIQLLGFLALMSCGSRDGWKSIIYRLTSEAKDGTLVRMAHYNISFERFVDKGPSTSSDQHSKVIRQTLSTLSLKISTYSY